MKILPRAYRPGEYVAFFIIDIPTQQGIAHAFLGCDLFSEFAFFIGTAYEDDKQTILEQIRQLMQHESFMIHRDKGFILVLGDYKYLLDDAEKIVRPFKGRVIFDPVFCKHIAKPVEEDFMKRFR